MWASFLNYLHAFYLFNLINCQFIRVFDKIKLYEFRISEETNNTQMVYDQLFSYLIDDQCSDLFYGDRKNNSIKPIKLEADILIYKSSINNFNFILEISFTSSKILDTLEAYEVNILDLKTRSRTCLRIIKIVNTDQIPKKEQKFKLLIKDPVILTPIEKYSPYFGKVSVSALIPYDHHIIQKQKNNLNQVPDLYVLPNSIVSVDAGIDYYDKALIYKNSFQNEPIRHDGYHLNERYPQICINLIRYRHFLLFDYEFRLNIKFNDFYFISQSTLVNVTYELKLHYFTCSKDSIVSKNLCSSHLQYSKLLRAYEKIAIEKLKSGFYAIEVSPRVRSFTCDEQCPYEQDENILCEKCKRIVYYFQVSSLETSSYTNGQYRCPTNKRDLNSNDYFYNFDEHMNNSFSISSDFKITFPKDTYERLKHKSNWHALQFIILTICIIILIIFTLFIIKIIRSKKLLCFAQSKFHRTPENERLKTNFEYI